MHDAVSKNSNAQDAVHDLWKALGIPSRGEALFEAVQSGLSYTVFEQLAQLTELGNQSLARAINISPRTLQRRIQSGKFRPDESDRLYRLAQVFAATLELFEGDVPAAQLWLRRPRQGLSGARPIDMVVTSVQTDAVLDLIGRLEHGVPA